MECTGAALDFFGSVSVLRGDRKGNSSESFVVTMDRILQLDVQVTITFLCSSMMEK